MISGDGNYMVINKIFRSKYKATKTGEERKKSEDKFKQRASRAAGKGRRLRGASEECK